MNYLRKRNRFALYLFLVIASFSVGIAFAEEPEPQPATVTFGAPSMSIPVDIHPGDVGVSGLLFRVDAEGSKDLSCEFPPELMAFVRCQPVDAMEIVIDAALLDLFHEIEPGGESIRVANITLTCEASFMDVVITPIQFDDDTGLPIETEPSYKQCGNN